MSRDPEIQAVNAPNDPQFVTHNLQWVDNSSTGFFIGWESKDGIEPILVFYNDEVYVITEAETDKEFVYWDANGDTAVFVGTDNVNDINTDGYFPLVRNDGGEVDVAWGIRIIYNQKLVADADAISDGIVNKQYSDTDKTKLGTIETSADVTLTHEAATIVSQGTLATRNSVAPSHIDALAVETAKINNYATRAEESVYQYSESPYLPWYPDYITVSTTNIITTQRAVETFASMAVKNYDGFVRTIRAEIVVWDPTLSVWIVVGYRIISLTGFEWIYFAINPIMGLDYFLYHNEDDLTFAVHCSVVQEQLTALKVSFRRLTLLEWRGK